MAALTPERLLTKAYEIIARTGEATNCGPDVKGQKSGTQALALYQDIQISTALNDTVRVRELLTKAQNTYGV
jgi:hypothetical protein